MRYILLVVLSIAVAQAKFLSLKKYQTPVTFANITQNVNVIDITALTDIEIKDVIINRGNCKSNFGDIKARRNADKITNFPEVGKTYIVYPDTGYFKKNEQVICRVLHQDNLAMWEQDKEFLQKNTLHFESVQGVLKNYIQFSDSSSAINSLSPDEENQIAREYYEFFKSAQDELVQKIIYAPQYSKGGELKVQGKTPDTEKATLQISWGRTCNVRLEGDITTISNILGEDSTYDDKLYNEISEAFRRQCNEIVAQSERMHNCLQNFFEEGYVANALNKYKTSEIEIEKLKKSGVIFKKVQEEVGEQFWKTMWKYSRGLDKVNARPTDKPKELPPFIVTYEKVVSTPAKTKTSIRLKYGEMIGGYTQMQLSNKNKLQVPLGIQVPNTCNIKEVEVVTNKGRETYRF